MSLEGSPHEPIMIETASLASNFEAKSFTDLVGFERTSTSPVYVQALDDSAKSAWQSVKPDEHEYVPPALVKYRQQFAKADIKYLRSACQSFGIPADKHRTVLIESLVKHLNDNNKNNTHATLR